MATVPERLRSLRESIKISQAKLAGISGTNQSTINRYEHGQSDAPYRILLWYADYFDVSLDYIFGRTDRPEGIKFGGRPEVMKQKITSLDNYREFIEFCFDPKSPMNSKLKDMMISLVAEDEVEYKRKGKSKNGKENNG